MTTDQLVDEIRDLDAKAAGKRMELAKMLGQDEEAQRYKREMYAICEARRAARFATAEAKGQCFFATAGEIDGAAPHA